MIFRGAYESLHLSVYDQNHPRCYVQKLLIFPFPDGTKHEAAVKALAEGLQLTLANCAPFLAGNVEPADPETGRISLRYPAVVPDVQEAGIFAFNMLSPGEYPHTYDTLVRDGIPQSAFPGSVFCPRALHDHVGIPKDAEGLLDCKVTAPVLAMEAIFIPGGLVLSSYFHHSVMDGTGHTTFLNHFAHQVSLLQRSDTLRAAPSSYIDKNDSLTSAPTGIFPNQSALRAQMDARIPHSVSPPSSDCYGSVEYKKTLSQDAPCTARIFVFSASRIRKLRDKLEREVDTVARMTRCNILAALIWIHVTRARGPRLIDHGYESTDLGIAVDMRKRMTPPLDETYMGDMAFFAKASASISDFTTEPRVTEQTVVRAIQEINRAIANVDNDWVMRQGSYFNSINPIRDTEVSLRFNRGPDMYITSWMHLGADLKWHIPGTSSASPTSIRRTSGNSDGGMIVYPRSAEVVDGVEQPYEILVRLATEDMDRLIAEDGGLASWTQAIVD